MSGKDYYAPGTWNAICSMCGFTFKANELSRNWQGMYRCSRCQEPRQPQDFVRAVPDIQTPPWVQKPTETFVSTDYLCTEASDVDDLDPMIYICTETLYPLETEN